MAEISLLVDGNNLLSRADFASQASRSKMSADGVNTGALVIFINLISKYVRLTHPTRMAIMWDAGHDFRDEIYPQYKAARHKHIEGSEDTVPFALAKEFLTLAGIPHKAHQGWEADDLIAATARQCTGRVAIVSGDKDLLQLLRGDEMHFEDDGVVQYKVPDDDPWTKAKYWEKFGYWPGQAAMVHALVGDTSDGVPGLRGIGPKKAVALLEEAGWDWEALLTLLGPEKAAVASTMRALVDLRDQEYPEWFMLAHRGAPGFFPVRLDESEDKVMRDFWQRQRLRDFCEQYELKTVLERLEDGSLWFGSQPDSTSSQAAFVGFEI